MKAPKNTGAQEVIDEFVTALGVPHDDRWYVVSVLAKVTPAGAIMTINPSTSPVRHIVAITLDKEVKDV